MQAAAARPCFTMAAAVWFSTNGSLRVTAALSFSCCGGGSSSRSNSHFLNLNKLGSRKARTSRSLLSAHTDPHTNLGGAGKARRTTLSTVDAHTINNGIEPFTWPQLELLFREDSVDGIIPSTAPNLQLFRRSSSDQMLYERHKVFLKRYWSSPYDYLLYNLFGPEFGFEKILVEAAESSSDTNKARSCCDLDASSYEDRDLPPEGFIYQTSPSLLEASQSTINNGHTFLSLVKNDFPYDVDSDIDHFCLWKIGGSCRTEGLLGEELNWALSELETQTASSRLVDRNDKGISLSAFASPPDFLAAKQTFYWTNPPHLQSLPEMKHAHILVLRK